MSGLICAFDSIHVMSFHISVSMFFFFLFRLSELVCNQFAIRSVDPLAGRPASLFDVFLVASRLFVAVPFSFDLFCCVPFFDLCFSSSVLFCFVLSVWLLFFLIFRTRPVFRSLKS